MTRKTFKLEVNATNLLIATGIGMILGIIITLLLKLPISSNGLSEALGLIIAFVIAGLFFEHMGLNSLFKPIGVKG